MDVTNNEGNAVKGQEKEMDVESAKIGDDLTYKIIRQVEYYFGDINLPKDQFMQEQLHLNEGWILSNTMMKFNRLANLSNDVNVIVTALSKSQSGLIEISEDKTRIRRNPNIALPAQTRERQKQLLSQSVYCKGFPRSSTLDNLLDFFEPYGKVLCLQMRKFYDLEANTSHFKGSTFTLFSTREEAAEFLNIEDLKYGDISLLRLWKSDYKEKKKLEYKQKAQVKEVLEEKKQAEIETVPKGLMLLLKGDLGNVTKEEIESTLEEKGSKVSSIYYNEGDEEALVCLQEENGATMFLKELKDNQLMLKNVCVQVCVVDREEKQICLKKAMSKIRKPERISKRRNAICEEFLERGESMRRECNEKEIQINDQGHLAKKMKIVEDLPDNENK